MRKLILLFFSFWLILSNSCTLKNSIVPNGNGENTVEIFQGLEKSSSGLASFTTKSCKVCAEKISAFTPVLSKTIIKNMGDIPLLILKSILLLGFLFSFEKGSGSINSLLPHRFSSRLYLQLKRLQIYA